MSEEGKTSVFEGAEVWSISDIDEGTWEKSIVRDIGHIGEIGGKLDVHVEIDGEQQIIKTKYEDDSVNEYQHVKPRSTVSYENVKDMDLPALYVINEPEALECLRFCHSQFIQYLSIGPLLVWINRFDVNSNDFNDKLYSTYYFEKDAKKDILNPAKPSAINSLYRKLLKLRPETLEEDRANQAMIMLGESGSGKSRAVRDICNHIAYITSKKLNQVPYGDDEFQPDVPFFNRINTILESFGHCQTARNTNSSRFSKSVKISFNEESGHISGIIFRCFHLELDRLTSQGNKESNYKIFYDIFDDIYFASQAMSRYGIDNMTMFRMTSTRPNTPFLPGRSSFKDLSSALEEVARIPRSKQNVMFGLLAGMLHLGEVEMEECDNYGDVSTVMSSDPVSIDHMNRVLKLLGITLEALLGVVSKRQLNFAGNIVEKNLDLNESLGAKDTFICQVYAALFRWIVSKMNEGIAAKFSNKPEVVETPSLPRRRNPFAEVEEPAESEDVFGEREEDAPTPKNTFSIYDIVGFENLERNTLEQLCVNYANERVFQYLNQMVFVIDKELFFTERLFVSTSHFFDNALTIRLLDSKSNGIFTICDDQLKLKSSTSDEKLSSILYAQHSNNKMFIASRAEHKNFEFIVKHYTNLVKYEIIGFTNTNKIEPAQEILECLQSSSIPFIQEELAPFCDIRTLSSSASHLSGLSPKPSVELTASLMSQKSSRNLGLDRAPSLRGPGAFERSPSARGPNAFNKSPSFRGAQSFDSPSTPPNRRDMFKRAASAHPSMNQGVSPFGSGNRGRTGSGGKPSKPNTLTSLTVLQLTEIMAEVKAAETSFHLCIRPNDTTFPNSFDQRAVCRQVRPYGIVNILSFYKQTYPYRTDHISFVNRYSPLAVFCKNSDKESADFMTALWTVRSLGLKLDKRNKDQWTELSHSLVSLLPDVPELEDLCRVLSGSTEAVSSPLELIKSGIRVGEKNVMMNALAYFYLNEAREMAVKLIGKIIWRAYKHKRDGTTNGSATLIGSIVRMHIAKRKAESIRMRDTVIMVQSLVRRYLVRRRQFRGELLIDGVNRDEIVAEKLVKAQAVWRGSFTRKKLAQLKLQKEDSGLSVGGDSSLRQNEGNICIEEMSMPEESVQATHRDDDMSLEPIKIASRGDDVQSEMSYVSDPLRHSGAFAASGSQSNAQLGKLRELQATIESLELENSRLKRKLQATEYEDFKEKDIGDDDGVDISPSRKLVTKQSSVGSYTPNSVYGGHVDSPFDSGAPDRKAPEYESYVSRTLKALENDLSYLLEPTPFWKFGRNGNVRKTMLVVSPDFQFLCWKPRNGLLKSSKETRVDLRLVWRLVSGQSTPPFEAYKGVTHGTMPPSRSFSLVYGFRSLDLCACDDETYDDWFTGLRYILQLFNGDVQEAGLDRQLLRRKWNFLDTKGYGFLSRKEVIHLVSNLGVRFDRSSFTAALLRSTIGNSTHDEITFSQFDSLVYQLRRRPDLEILWSKILVGYDFSRDVFPLHVDGDLDTAILHEVIGVPTFKHFWKLSQGRVLHDDEAVQMMSEGMGEMYQEDFPVLSYNGFVNLMTHPKNDAYNPVSVMLSAKDMSHPLQHYYIATSDGPSLHPHRRAGDEDEDDETAALAEGNTYANAILSGCRALELRCYEERVNPKGIDTDVYVGRDRGEFRMTFKETLLHIHRVAFKTSPFPLIMMLEMNADLAQQKRCAKLLKKIFGDAIYTPAEVQGSMLPSPNELRNRVIIFLTHRKRDIHGAYKVDNAHNSSVMSLPMGDLGSFMSPGMSSKMSNDDDDDFGEDVKLVDEDIVDDVEGDDVLNGAMATPLRTVSSDRNSPSASKRDYHIVDPESKFKRSGTMDQSAVDVLAKCQGVYPSLMRLCHYSHGLRIGSHSVRDMLARLAENPEAEGALVKYNMKRFSYIYMDRTTKSFGSYGGMVRAWDCGASLVSACHDEPSLGTKINHGRFRSNGGCGYVLKHVRYRSPREYLPPAPHILSLHVISGRDLIVHAPKANDTFLNQSTDSLDQSRNPSVRETDLSSTKPRRVKDKGLSVVVDLNGLSCEDIQQKTRAIKKHGASPFWNEVFSFSLKDATVGQITLRVFSNDVCTGFVSIPLAHLRSGYRTLALYEEKEENNHVASPMDMSSLFVRVKFDSLTDFNTYSQADLPAAYTEAENLKLMSGVNSSAIPNGSIPRRNTDGSEYSPARPSERHKLRTSSGVNAESGSPMGSQLSGSFHRSPPKDAMSPMHHGRSLDRNSWRDREGYRRSKSRDDRDYRRSSSSRDRDEKYRRSSSRGDRDLERRHSKDYRRSSSRSPSKDPERRRSSSSRDRDDKYRRSSSRGDRDLERRHSSEYRRSSSRGDRDLERRHSSEYRRSSSRGDRDKRNDRRHSSGDNHRGSSSRDRDDKYRRSSSSRSDRDRHSRSSGDIKRDRDRESSSRRHHSSSDVLESSNRRSSRRSSRDGSGLQKLPSVVENDAEHHDTDDFDTAQGDMGNGAIGTYDSDSPLKHELNELRLSPKHSSSRSPQGSGGEEGEDQYSVGRKVNEVDYQSGDDDGANDPWTPPV